MFIKACYHFLTHLRVVKNASEHTIRNYAIDLNALKNFIESQQFPEIATEDLPPKIDHHVPYSERSQDRDTLIKIEDIDKKFIRRFLADLTSKDHNKSTIVRRLSSLRTFFRYALAEKFITHNPTEEIESPKIDRRVPVSLSYQQVQKLLEQPNTVNYLGFRDRTIMELLYSSGLRISELVAMNRVDFDADNLQIRIRGKGKKERVIPITQNAATWIKAYLSHPERHHDFETHMAQQDPEAIFLNKLGTRLTVRSIDRSFEKYLKNSGLEAHITPHTIRHTIATHWLENGMDLKAIQLILGHRSLAATTIYTQVSPKLKQKTYKRSHPRA